MTARSCRSLRRFWNRHDIDILIIIAMLCGGVIAMAVDWRV